MAIDLVAPAHMPKLYSENMIQLFLNKPSRADSISDAGPGPMPKPNPEPIEVSCTVDVDWWLE